MAKKVFSQFTATPYKGESNSGEIMTVPDQALTIRQLLDNFTRGVDRPPSQLEFQFDEDNYYPDPRSLDLTDIDQYKRATEDLYREAHREAQKFRAGKKPAGNSDILADGSGSPTDSQAAGLPEISEISEQPQANTDSQSS